MSIADQLPELVDLKYRDPFDISKALEGAALDHLNPEVKRFELHTDYSPSGDQPKAIEKLISQLENSQERCVLLGVTGSGKTFTMANIIERMNIPTLIISHNKTLARQLHHEVAEYFPKMLWNITYLTMTTINLRPILQREICTLTKRCPLTKG